jgi:cytochrome c553
MRPQIFLATTVAILSVSIPPRSTHAQPEQHSYCGRPVSLAATPVITDALVVLQTAVDIQDCEPELCDVTADCLITVTDARDVLAAAAALAYDFNCSTDCSGLPCENGVAPVCGGRCGNGSACAYVDEVESAAAGGNSNLDSGSGVDPNRDPDTESGPDPAVDRAWIPPAGTCVCVPDAEDPEPTTTTTTTTIGLVTSTSSTSTSSSSTVTEPAPTTTTLAAGGDAERGRALYDGACAACHVLGDHDVTPGIGPDLGGDGADLLADMLLINPIHAAVPEPPGSALSDQELNDLKAFIDTFPEIIEPEAPLP